MKRRKGFTLVELMLVVLIATILLALSLPILRGRVSAAKWSEGRTMAGQVATSIRACIVGGNETGEWDKDSLTPAELGLSVQDFEGQYFKYENYNWDVVYDGVDLTFLITVTKPDGIGWPEQLTLDYKGNWE